MNKQTADRYSTDIDSSYPALLRAARKAQAKAREMGLEPVVREDEPESASENGSTASDDESSQ